MASITRIQNNQITDSTILGYAKIASQSLTGNLFAPSLTLAGNLTILGNLFLSNTGNTTTINSTNTYINDPVVTFNNGYTGSLTGYDIGMLVNRNKSSLNDWYSAVNTAFVWVENDKAFEAIVTTSIGSDEPSLVRTGYADVVVGNLTVQNSGYFNGPNLTVSSGTYSSFAGTTVFTGPTFISGALTAPSFNGVIGNVTPNLGFFTTANATNFYAPTIGNVGTTFYGSGAQITNLNASNLSSGNVPSNVLTGYYDFITGIGAQANLTVIGFSNLGAVTASSISANTIGNVGATLYGTINQASSAQTNILTVGNLTYLNVAGVLTSWGNIVAASGVTSTSPTTGAFVVPGTGGVGVGGDIWSAGNIHANIGGALSGNVLVSANLIPVFTGGQVNLGSYANPFNELFLSGRTITLGGSTLSVDTSTGAVVITPNATTLNPTPPSFVLTANGTITTTTASSAAVVGVGVQTATTQTVLANILVNSGSTSVSTNTGALQVSGGLGLTGNIYFGEKIYSPNGTSGNPTYSFATGKNTGTWYDGSTLRFALAGTDAFIINSTGPDSLQTHQFVSGTAANPGIVGASYTTTGIFFPGSGQIGFSSAGTQVAQLNASGTASTTPTTGAFVVTGGAGVNGALNVWGTATAGGGLQNTPVGNATPNTGAFTTLSSSTTYTLNTGTAASLQATAIGNVTPGTGAFTTLTGGSFQGIIGNVTPAAGTFTTLNASGITQVTNATQSTSVSTGALQVTGGVGIGANLTVGGNATVQGNLTVNGTLTYINTTTTQITGTEVVAGTLIANSGAAASSTTTGALQVSGGAGVTGALWVGGLINAQSATFSALNNTPIGATTPSTGNFTALTAASFQGVVGNVAPNYANFTTVDASILRAATVGNTGASIYGTIQTAAQTNITAVGTLNGLTVASGYTVLINGTANNNALNYSSGALQVSGGAGFASNVYIGGNLTVSGNITTSLGNINVVTVSGNSAQFFGNAAGFGALYAGINSGYVFQPQTVFQASSNFNGYAQVNAQNINGGANASTDFIATADNGTATSGYVDMGINSSGFVGGTGNELNYPLDGYLYVQGTTGTNGNLLLGTGNAADIVFSTGGFSTTNNYQGRFKNGVGLILAQPTAAINTTSGALQVAGGVGVIGNVYAGNFIGPVGTTTSANTGIFTSLTATSNIADNGGGLTTTASTGYLFNDTATTLNIGSAAATVNMGSTSGTVTLNNPTIATSVTSGTLALFNTGLTGTLNVAGAASAINIGSASSTMTFAGTTLTGTNTTTVNLNGTSPTIATTSTGTVSLFNTNALTVNAFGAATTIGIGNASGTTTIQGITKHTGNVVAAATTATNDNNSGSIIAKGGIAATGNINIGGQQFVGSGSQATVLTGALTVARGTSSTGAGTQYTQAALINATNTGSSDYIAYGNNYPGPSNDHGWMDLGFTGDAFNDPNYSITKANDGYIFASGANATVGGNLVMSTDSVGSYNDIVIGVGGFSASSEVARFHGNVGTNGTLTLKLPTNGSGAVTANTGAFQVWGGASFSGNVYHGGAAVFNGTQTSGYDTIVKGVNDSTLLWAHASSSYDQVVIGGSLAQSSVPTAAKLVVNSSDSMVIPQGSSAQRPSSGQSVLGMIRYNSTLNNIEFWNGANWVTPNSVLTAINDQQFNGDGTTVSFTLGQTSLTNNVLVSINGVVQIPGASYAYTVTGATLTFTQAPATGDVIDVRILTTLTNVSSLADSGAGYNYVSTIVGTGVQIATGNIGANVQYTFTPTGAMVTNSPNVQVAGTSATSIDVFPTAAYSSAKYLITATNTSTGARQMSEVFVVTDGSTSANVTTLTSLTSPSSANWVTFTAAYSAGNVTLSATSTTTNTNYRIKRDYQAV